MSSAPELTIRLVVGGNAILEAGDARVLVYASTEHDPVQILLPPRDRWVANVAADFPIDFDGVVRAIRTAGHDVLVTAEAAVSSSSSRSERT